MSLPTTVRARGGGVPARVTGVPTRAPDLVLVQTTPPSRRRTAMLDCLVRAISGRRPGIEVHVAQPAGMWPSLEEIVVDLDRRGRQGVLVPLLLARLPQLPPELLTPVPARGVVSGGVLGPDPMLASILLDRVYSCGAQLGDTIIIAGPHEHPGAADDLQLVAEHVRRSWPGRVLVAERPDAATVTATLEAARTPTHRAVVLAPYVLTEDTFTESLRDVPVDRVARPLTCTATLVSLVESRYETGRVRLERDAELATGRREVPWPAGVHRVTA